VARTFAELLALAIKQAIGSSASEVEEKRDAHHRASQVANSGGAQSLTDQGMLIDSREAMRLLKVAKRTLWQMHTTGKMPPPIRIGRAIRWRLEVLKQWVEAGCPVDPEWRTKGA
jgi:predicted DNA-binding transcriptional regulator AlpA